MKPFAIYTAIVGGFDNIQQPIVVDERFNYLLFSNEIEVSNVGVWQVRKIEYDNQDRIKIARWVKTHPEILLDKYEFSVWIDANIQIKTDYLYRKVLELYNNKELIAAVIHPERNCIYKEMFAVYDLGLETEKTILEWAKLLCKNHYPTNRGLNETGILYRNHKQSIIKKFDEFWWACIERYSRRDQLSFNYVLWKLNVKCVSLLPARQSAAFSGYFNYIPHIKWRSKLYNKSTDFSLLRRYYIDLPEKKKEIENVYYKIFQKHFPKFWAFVYGQYYRIKFHIDRRKNIMRK